MITGSHNRHVTADMRACDSLVILSTVSVANC